MNGEDNMHYEIKRGFEGAEKDTKVIWNESETRFIALTKSNDAAYWVDFELNAPIRDTYIMIPACAYNGNRFEAVERHYPPMFLESEMGVDVPIRMTEVPRLSKEGDSFMDVTTGDMAVPCVCVFNKKLKKAFMVFFNQGDHGLNHGVTLEQTGDKLLIRLRAPVKRRLIYHWYSGIPTLCEDHSVDEPLKVKRGEETVIPHHIFTFDCEDIPALYREFFARRHQFVSGAAHANLPFSAFWNMAEKELNATHYLDDLEMYTLDAQDGRRTSHFGVWQAGWVGGGMNSLAGIFEGSELTRQRSVKTLIFAANHQSKTGWYYGCADSEGKVRHDCFSHYEGKYNMVLIRKHVDLVFFMFRQIIALRKMNIEVPQIVFDSAVSGANAVIELWKKYGQLGQFINAETGEIVVGNSTSGAMAPACLCAAYNVTGDEMFAKYAREIGDFYYRTATMEGVTTGGPGEILQAPDSESATALVESFVALYEMDGTDKWLNCACDAANQLSSWVVSYDYNFPENSAMGKLHVKANGSVWANVQNKHSAPGLCTASPISLLKIYRATGDEKYLELMCHIAHFMPQTVSYSQRPVITSSGKPLKDSEICERVNTSDWEGKDRVGGNIFGACSWPQVSMMLTWTDMPGVYVIPSRDIVCVSDHVNAWVENDKLYIQNTTEFDAIVKVLVENEENIKEKLGFYWHNKFHRVPVKAGETVSVCLNIL